MRTATLLCFIFFVSVSQSYANNAAKSEKQSSIKTSLTLSGGVSLGAYQAGLNYPLIDRNRHSISVLSGTSAGAINAIQSAIMLCTESSEHITAANNTFLQSWVDVGFDKLMPENKKRYDRFDIGDGNRIDDAIFSRKAFDLALSDIRSNFSLKGLKAKENCDIKLGIAVTSAEPFSYDIDNDQGSFSIKEQSFYVLLSLKSHNGKLYFENCIEECNVDRSGYSRQLMLLNDSKRQVPIEQVLKLALASSAYPFVFGAMPVDVCFVSTQVVSCRNIVKQTIEFIDGGMFNNIPLNLSTALIGNSAGRYIYIHPSNTSNRLDYKAARASQCKGIKQGRTSVGRYNGKYFIDAIGNAASTHLNSQLTEALRGNFRTGRNRPLYFSERNYFVIGNFLGKFGAFLSKKFREYDYVVGLYDGIVQSAAMMQQAEEAAGAVRHVNSNDSILAEEVKLNEQDLYGIESGERTKKIKVIVEREYHYYFEQVKDQPWGWVLRYLYQMDETFGSYDPFLETSENKAKTELQARLEAGDPYAQIISAIEKTSDECFDEFLSELTRLNREKAKSDRKLRKTLPKVEQTAIQVSQKKYQALDQFEMEGVDKALDEDAIASKLVNNSINRLIDIEGHTSKPGFVLGFLKRGMVPRKSLVTNPKDSVFIGGKIGLDAAQGSILFAPYIHKYTSSGNTFFTFEPEIDLVLDELDNTSWVAYNSLNASHAFDNVLFSSAGAGINTSWDSKTENAYLGWQLRFGLLNDLFELQFRSRDFNYDNLINDWSYRVTLDLFSFQIDRN